MFCNNKKKEGGWRSSPGHYTGRVYLAGWVLSVVGFQGWGLTSMAANCWEVDCSSPALYSKDILGGRRGRGTHSSVGWSRWHRSSCMRHFSVFLFQSFPPSVDGCYFRLQRHVVFSDFLQFFLEKRDSLCTVHII